MNAKTVTVRVTRRFKASPEQVFDAWLDPAKAKAFLFAVPGGEIVRADIDAWVGGGFTIVDRRDGMDVEHLGRYLEIVRPRRLKFSFRVPKYSNADSWVAIDIAPVEGGCELTLTHEGVLVEFADKSPEGWRMIFDRLAALLASG